MGELAPGAAQEVGAWGQRAVSVVSRVPRQQFILPDAGWPGAFTNDHLMSIRDGGNEVLDSWAGEQGQPFSVRFCDSLWEIGQELLGRQ